MSLLDDEIRKDIEAHGIEFSRALLPQEQGVLLRVYRLGILAAARALSVSAPEHARMLENVARAPVEKKTKAYGSSTYHRVSRILEEISGVASAYGVTSWERTFLHSIHGIPRLSDKQRDVLAKIEGKVFGEQDDE